MAAPARPTAAEIAASATIFKDSFRSGRIMEAALGASRLGLTVCADAALIKLVGRCCTGPRTDRIGSKDSLTMSMNGERPRFLRADGEIHQYLQ